jgi:uncharacterized membrane protein
MRNLILTLAATGAILAGSLAMPNLAEARPRGWGGYYRAPAGRYYRPYRYYGGYYAPRRYYNNYYGYPYRYSWGGPGVYFRF